MSGDQQAQTNKETSRADAAEYGETAADDSAAGGARAARHPPARHLHRAARPARGPAAADRARHRRGAAAQAAAPALIQGGDGKRSL